MPSEKPTNENEATTVYQQGATIPTTVRVKKRIAIPTAFVLLTVAVAILVWIRGTWADAIPKNPASSQEGIVTQLLQVDQDHKQVRSAVVVDRPLGDVWKAITDYDHFPRIFRNVSSAKASPQPDGTVQLDGAVTTIVGNWEFSTRLKHEESSDVSRVTWDDSSGEMRMNRGSWTVQRLDERRTLIVYALEIEVKHYPSFLVRSALLTAAPEVLRSLQSWLAQSSSEST